MDKNEEIEVLHSEDSSELQINLINERSFNNDSEDNENRKNNEKNTKIYLKINIFKIFRHVLLWIILFLTLQTYFLEGPYVRIVNKLPEEIFIVCIFGKNEFKDEGRQRHYLNALEQTMPGATVVFCLSTFTKIDRDIVNHRNISFRFERYGNGETRLMTNIYYFYHFYFNGLRYAYYEQLLRDHPEVKYVTFSDDDTLFMGNPFSLINKENNTHEVHVMNDDGKFLYKMGPNWVWTGKWSKLSNKTKDRCNIWRMNFPLDSPKIADIEYKNAGLMIGRRDDILNISALMGQSFLCPGMFINNAEQGLLNYLYITGQLNSTGAVIVGHYIRDGVLISCPDHINHNRYKEIMNSSNVIAIHHYQRLYNKDYFSISSERLKNLMTSLFAKMISFLSSL